MFDAARRLWEDEEGTTSVEYALLLAVIVIGCIGAWTALRNRLTAVLDEATDALADE